MGMHKSKITTELITIFNNRLIKHNILYNSNRSLFTHLYLQNIKGTKILKKYFNGSYEKIRNSIGSHIEERKTRFDIPPQHETDGNNMISLLKNELKQRTLSSLVLNLGLYDKNWTIRKLNGEEG